jgi:hypothetical protein
MYGKLANLFIYNEAWEEVKTEYKIPFGIVDLRMMYVILLRVSTEVALTG